jgi:ATP-binding cassette, subfamily C (CFTR/MRP), member 1
VKACSLEKDFEMLPNGERTEIGEKGINLSGTCFFNFAHQIDNSKLCRRPTGDVECGNCLTISHLASQARVSLARAAYSKSDVVLLDDSLSALDAYVAQSIIDKCILTGPLAGRTRVLVTHGLHVLEKTDYIYIMDNGTIIEHGTYDVGNFLKSVTTMGLSDIILVQTLMESSVDFAHLIDEYGSHETIDKVTRKNTRKPTMHPKAAKRQNTLKPLIQSEERTTGSVPWVAYIKYFRFAGSVLWIPAIIILVLLSQTASGKCAHKGIRDS